MKTVVRQRPRLSVSRIAPAVLALVLLSSCMGGLKAQPVSAADPASTPEPALRLAMAARQKAHREGDTRKVEELMASGYVQTDIGGRVQNRAEWLAGYFVPLSDLIKSGQFRWEVFEESDDRVFSFGDTAVEVGRLALKGKGASWVAGRGWVASPHGNFGPAELVFTRVWIKRDGRWLLAAVHNSLPPK